MTKIERILITKTPLAFVLKKSKHWYLPGFEGVPLYDVARFFYGQIKTVGLTAAFQDEVRLIDNMLLQD